MYRKTKWLPWLGLACWLASGCGASNDDTGRSAVSAGSFASPQAGSAAAAAIAGSAGIAGTSSVPSAMAGAAPTLAGRGPAGAPAPASAGAAGLAAAGRAGGLPVAGMPVAGMRAMGIAGMAGMSSGVSGIGAAGAASGAATGTGETGRLVGMTAAHNAVRAMVQTTPPLPPLTWSPTLAAYAQEWADNLAKTQCMRPMHRSSQDLRAKNYGENLAAAGGVPAPMTTAQWATDGWAGEVKCWTYGTFGAELGGTEKCDTKCYMDMHSDGCGHYTQIIWRNTKELGCGVASCQAGGATYDIWICNYSPPGNIVSQKPY